jgi:membrane protein implicated in regulation of membrane protease activity
MWGIFLIIFGAVVVTGSLLIGWGIPFVALFGVALVVVAILAAFRRPAEETSGIEDHPREQSWAGEPGRR